MSGTTIIAACPDCGPQNLRPSALHLTVYSHGEGHTYAFFCPGCTEEVTRAASEEVLMQLMNAGVSSSEVIVPLEVLEHPPVTAPPISVDDVMEFVVELRQFGRLVAPEGGL